MARIFPSAMTTVRPGSMVPLSTSSTEQPRRTTGRGPSARDAWTTVRSSMTAAGVARDGSFIGPPRHWRFHEFREPFEGVPIHTCWYSDGPRLPGLPRADGAALCEGPVGRALQF